ncbi:MAG: hypothetical protein QGI09_10170, partial [Dehalococcoidia bacterium]|nr:hypothetical protein [Dehalococcoidia bacterium]
DLDEVGYEGGAGDRRQLDARLADVHTIVVQPAGCPRGYSLVGLTSCYRPQMPSCGWLYPGWWLRGAESYATF